MRMTTRTNKVGRRYSLTTQKIMQWAMDTGNNQHATHAKPLWDEVDLSAQARRPLN